MKKPKRIFIVGHMGAGKALLSKSLAKKLGWEYIDASPGLERLVGRSVVEILGQPGAKEFYQCQSEIITHCSNKSSVVIDTDDSVIMSEKNRKLLSEEFVVYLKVSTPTQIERMADNQAPMLPIVGIKEFLDKRHSERDSLFEEVATLIIESVCIENDVDSIVANLDNR